MRKHIPTILTVICLCFILLISSCKRESASERVQACGGAPEYAEFIIDGTTYCFTSPDFFTNDQTTGAWGIYTNKTSIQCLQATTNAGGFALTFHNNMLTGTFPIAGGYFHYPPEMGTSHFNNPSPTVNITAFGPAGGFIEGNYNQEMNFGGTLKTVVCHFRVKR